MKIAFLSTFYPFRGGIAQFNASMFRETEKKHKVEAFTFSKQYPDFLFPGETQYVTENDKVDSIPAKRVLNTINPFTYFSTARKIRNTQPDVLIVKYWMTFFAPSLGTALRRQNKRTKRICILDNLIPHEGRFFDKPFNKYFLKSVDGFVVMSDSVQRDLLQMKPDAKHIRLNHPLYDHFGAPMTRENACEKLGLDKSKRYALFFGFIRGYKGLDILIDAMKEVKDVELIVAGEVYGSFDDYQQQIDKSGYSDKIHLFNRYISDDEVTAFFSAADVCVLPYKSATQSGITAISYHFETPIIATNVGGLKETIVDGETGIIVENPNSSEVAMAINRFFTESDKSHFTAKIQEFKRQNSWETFMDEVLKFSESIVK